jgi:competence protein ComEA
MSLAIVAALLCAGADPSAPAHAARKKPGKPPMAGVLNVNRASEAELRLLPGIGKKRAAMIVEHRDKRPFTSLDELGRLKGMRGVVRRLKQHLAVSGDSTLRPAALDPPGVKAVQPGATTKSAAVAPPEGGLEGSRSNAGAVPPL